MLDFFGYLFFCIERLLRGTASSTSITGSELEVLSGTSSSISLLVRSVLATTSVSLATLTHGGTGTSLWHFGFGAGSLGTLLTLEGGWHNFWGEMEEVTEVLDSLVAEVPVVVAPGELLVNKTARLQGLAGLDDMQVWYVDIGVLSQMKIFLSHHDTLHEELLIDGYSVGLGHQHFLD